MLAMQGWPANLAFVDTVELLAWMDWLAFLAMQACIVCAAELAGLARSAFNVGLAFDSSQSCVAAVAG